MRDRSLAWRAVWWAVLPVAAVAVLASLSVQSSVDTWYVALNKPSFTPPNWVFPVAWTILYTLMALAFYLVISEGVKNTTQRVAIQFFYFQLLLNLAWTYIFFSLHLPGIALIEILALILVIIFTMLAFWDVRKLAGWLLAPYLGWVLFATALTAAVTVMN